MRWKDFTMLMLAISFGYCLALVTKDSLTMPDLSNVWQQAVASIGKYNGNKSRNIDNTDDNLYISDNLDDRDVGIHATSDTPEPSNHTVVARLEGQTLIINGSDNADWVEIEQNDTQIVVHSFTETREPLERFEFNVGDVSVIHFFGNDGNDRFYAVHNDKIITIDTVIDTGTGSNFIIGGRGENTFLNNGTESSMFIWIGMEEQRRQKWIDGNYQDTEEIRKPGNNRFALGHKKGDKDGLLLLSYNGDWFDALGNSVVQKAWMTRPDNPPRPWKGEEVLEVVQWIEDAKKIIGNYKFFSHGRGALVATTSDEEGGGHAYGGSLTLLKHGRRPSTFYHEVAHCWDAYGMSSSLISFDILLSPHTYIPEGVNRMNKYGIKKDAVQEDFASSYGMSNSAEDWATMVEYYLTNKGKPLDNRSKRYHGKFKVVDEFFKYTINPPPPNPPEPRNKLARELESVIDPDAKPIMIPGTNFALMPAHMGVQGFSVQDKDNPRISYPTEITYYDWTEEDIEYITAHVAHIRKQTGGYGFLKFKSGELMRCFKFDGGSYGQAGQGEIFLTPEAVKDCGVFVHEIAHLWGFQDNPYMDAFRNISWDASVCKDDDISHFVSDYARTNSAEDWAEAVTAVLVPDRTTRVYNAQPGSSKRAQKMQIARKFLNWVK